MIVGDDKLAVVLAVAVHEVQTAGANGIPVDSAAGGRWRCLVGRSLIIES